MSESSSDHSLVVDICDPSPSHNPPPADLWQVKISTSTSTLPSNPSVKFAPLPELAVRKRRSAIPLGVAARAQLVRRRRNLVESQPRAQQQQHPPAHRDNKKPTQVRVQSGRNREHSEVEESFLALGKVMKGVWRRVSNGGRLESHGVAENSAEQRHVTADIDEGDSEDDMGPTDLGEDSEDEGSDEEVGVKFREDISQTETVRDRSAYTIIRKEAAADP